jgi:3-hydroxy-9,10-secoandrosta-1,3,5(10)-triene-9,17-dione monooxygenase reductase component
MAFRHDERGRHTVRATMNKKSAFQESDGRDANTNNAAVMVEQEIQIGSSEFRNVMGHFGTGVVVIAGLVESIPFGLTCQSFMSVSLDPPLVCFCPSHTSTSWQSIRTSNRFSVNVLALDQRATCEAFAISGSDKFRGVQWRLSECNNPLIEGSIAYIDCDIVDVLDAGDHDIVVGRVRDLKLSRPSAPLFFYQGQFTSLHQAT